jgi:hypothetical protein
MAGEGQGVRDAPGGWGSRRLSRGIKPQARACKPIAGGQVPRTGTGSDHADCQPLTVGGAVAAQEAALVIDGRLAVND